jgi:hypothetical protein
MHTKKSELQRGPILYNKTSTFKNRSFPSPDSKKIAFVGEP